METLTQGDGPARRSRLDLPVHPLLFAATVVIAYWVDTVVSPHAAFRSLLVAVVGAALLTGIVWLLMRNLARAGIFVSIFLDPDIEQIDAAKGVGAQQVELCTAEYAELTLSARAAHGDGQQRAAAEVERIKAAAEKAKSHGLIVAAGHGLTYRNIGALAAIPEITEFNIGHNIISRSVFVGLNQAVREMIDSIARR